MFADSSAWYTYQGDDSDTVLSSRVRITRNIRSVAFPSTITPADAEKIYNTIVQLLPTVPQGKRFQVLRIEELDGIALKIFEERSVLPINLGKGPAQGLIIRDDGVISATINVKDHLRLAAFSAGFALESCYAMVEEVEQAFADKIDFSAVQDFGYLSSEIASIGSGLKGSVLCSLPGFFLTNRIQDKLQELTKQNFEVYAYYAQNTKKLLGYLYLISSKSSAGNTVAEQLEHITDTVRQLIREERALRQSLVTTQLWRTQDTIFKAFAFVRHALLLDVKDTTDALFKIKLGINLGFIEGITCEICTALLYQIQTAHIAFLLLNGKVNIEANMHMDELRIERIRALLVQEVLKNAVIHTKGY